jgi:predicted ATP-dependent serine protease
MLSASRAISKAQDAAPLPVVAELSSLHELGVLPRMGQMLMIVGQPGAGKSTFALWYAFKLALPCLYFSADMAAHTAATRLAALVTGETVDWCSGVLEGGGSEWLGDELSTSPISWCFDSSPSMQDIADELDAYVELFDAYPAVIVIDNAMNVEGSSDEGSGGLRYILSELHRLARETGSAVVVLHHAREEGNPLEPSAREKVQGKVAQLPEIILTVALDGDEFKIAPVKNRNGYQDPTGKNYRRLAALPEKASFDHYIPKLYGGFYSEVSEPYDWGVR